MSASETHYPQATTLALLAGRIRRDLQFSNIFLVDLTASLAYALATLLIISQGDLAPKGELALIWFGVAYLGLHAAKILLVIYLERQGGDAREFVGSERLVTSGFYAFSRNPVYLLSLAQSLIWSLALIFGSAGGHAAWVAYYLAPLLLYAHYWGMDRLIIPNEEAALRLKHPVEFGAYCARVRRWLGRRPQGGNASR
jgi:protein-S-isoprenylcysteine O-methyltransferase Ste14